VHGGGVQQIEGAAHVVFEENSVLLDITPQHHRPEVEDGVYSRYRLGAHLRIAQVTDQAFDAGRLSLCQTGVIGQHQAAYGIAPGQQRRR
jgi:hypothetical protein